MKKKGQVVYIYIPVSPRPVGGKRVENSHFKIMGVAFDKTVPAPFAEDENLPKNRQHPEISCLPLIPGKPAIKKKKNPPPKNADIPRDDLRLHGC